MRPRVQRASGIPCALFLIEGEEFPAKLGRNASRECEDACGIVGWAKRSVPTIQRDNVDGGHGAIAPLPTLHIGLFEI
jgi:hypothetical protein